ncbi:uncharacterized protein [Lepeophtheirus salmonis]|uniref:uncharacterized protein n=1 Tax=Lepeophtheirus salmonis TaxID=72036 RepID=UPI003AF37F0D
MNKKIFLLLFLTSAPHLSHTKEELVIDFPNNGTTDIPSVVSFTQFLQMNGLLKSTFCIRVKFAFLRPFSPIFSICEKNEDNRCVRLELIEDELIWTHYKFRLTSPNIKNRLQSKEWNLICGTKAKLEKAESIKYELILNGEVMLSKIDKTGYNIQMDMDVQFFLGQTNKNFVSDRRRAFVGSIGALMYKEYEVGLPEIRKIYKCKRSIIEDNLILKANDQAGLELSNAKMRFVRKKDICEKKTSLFYIPFLEKRSFNESLILCKSLGGKITRPLTKTENQRLSKIAFSIKEECAKNERDNSADLGRLIWLNLEKKGEDWIDPITKANVQFFNWKPEAQLYNCAFMKSDIEIKENGLEWSTTYCSDRLQLKLCTICEFSNKESPSLRFRLGGLCKESQLDREFYVREPKNKKQFDFNGHSTSLIIWHTSRKAWLLKDTVSKEEAFLTDLYPIGRRNWTFVSSPCSKQKNKDVILSLTICEETDFSCDNGDCISIKERCDKIKDCSDGSDEKDCSLVIIPDNYEKNISPSTRLNIRNKKKLAISIRWFINQMSDFKYNSFAMTFFYNLTWRDSRLSFQNLIVGDKSLNVITDDSQIWKPKIIFPLSIDYNLLTNMLMLERNSNPIIDRYGPKDNLVFKGLDTSITHQQGGRANFFCDFSYIYYPFDQQRCDIKVIVTESTGNIVHLIGEAVEFNSLQTSSEYWISSATFMSYNTSKTFSEVILQLSVYKSWSRPFILFFLIPLFISGFAYMTLWLETEEILLRVFIAFSSVFLSLGLLYCSKPTIPSTLYFKVVDVWLFFFLLVDISISVLHIIIIHILGKNESKVEMNQTEPIYFGPIEFKLGQEKKIKRMMTRSSEILMIQKLNNSSRLGIAVLTALFVSINIFLIIFHVLNY